MVVVKKSSRKRAFGAAHAKVPTGALRMRVSRILKASLGGDIKITKADIDEAMKFVKRRYRKFADLYAFSPFDPLEMCIAEYLHEMFD